MATAAAAAVATADSKMTARQHIEVALPKPPSPSSIFTPSQWETVYALADTIVPSFSASTDLPDSNRSSLDYYPITSAKLDEHYARLSSRTVTPISRPEFEAYLMERCVDNPDFRDNMTRVFGNLPDFAQKQLGGVLTLLNTRYATFALTGTVTPFPALPLSTRESILQSWQSSRLATLRGLEKTLSALCKRAYIQTSPLWNALSGWTDLPPDYVATPPVYEYKFRQFPAAGRNGEPVVEVFADVVIVGSGCGGGVAAKVLSERGYKVVVVDKGYYFSPQELPMKSETAEMNLFEGKGLLGTDDGNMTVLCGSCWGGGGTVNWGVSLRTPKYVRDGWAKERGLGLFKEGGEFDGCLDRVCEFMGVSDDGAEVRQSRRGQHLLDGAKGLGWKAKVTPHNSGGKDHHCAHCHMGCGSAGKQGPAVSWLPAAGKAGAEFIEGFQADRILFESYAGTKQKAVGVEGIWTARDANGKTAGAVEDRVKRKLVIKAKRVIVSGGSISSPVLLKKSGLGNPHIGRNLYMHPVQCVAGYWDEDVKPWEGCAITSVCTTFEDLDNRGNGFKMEPLCMVPYLVFANMPWRNALDFKLEALEYRHMGVFFAMPRDRDTGRVYPDPNTGATRVDYAPSAFDRAHAMEGVIALARICYTAGAREIRPYLPGTTSFYPATDPEAKKGESERFEAWLQEVKAAGNPATAPWGCAHQMGSNRMSKSADEGAVDPKGKVWGHEGLYVADASVLPSASGVNPMVTTMAIADYISRGIADDLDSLKRM